MGRLPTAAKSKARTMMSKVEAALELPVNGGADASVDVLRVENKQIHISSSVDEIQIARFSKQRPCCVLHCQYE